MKHSIWKWKANYAAKGDRVHQRGTWKKGTVVDENDREVKVKFQDEDAPRWITRAGCYAVSLKADAERKRDERFEELVSDFATEQQISTELARAILQSTAAKMQTH